FLTDGANAPPTAHTPRGPAMAALRQREARRAAAALGVPCQNIHHLLYPDSTLAELSASQQENAVAKIRKLLCELQPTEIFIPHHRDRHPDHEATYRLARTAAKECHGITTVLEYPIWLGWSSSLCPSPFSHDL